MKSIKSKMAKDFATKNQFARGGLRACRGLSPVRGATGISPPNTFGIDPRVATGDKAIAAAGLAAAQPTFLGTLAERVTGGAFKSGYSTLPANVTPAPAPAAPAPATDLGQENIQRGVDALRGVRPGMRDGAYIHGKFAGDTIPAVIGKGERVVSEAGEGALRDLMGGKAAVDAFFTAANDGKPPAQVKSGMRAALGATPSQEEIDLARRQVAQSRIPAAQPVQPRVAVPGGTVSSPEAAAKLAEIQARNAQNAQMADVANKVHAAAGNKTVRPANLGGAHAPNLGGAHAGPQPLAAPAQVSGLRPAGTMGSATAAAQPPLTAGAPAPVIDPAIEASQARSAAAAEASAAPKRARLKGAWDTARAKSAEVLGAAKAKLGGGAPPGSPPKPTLGYRAGKLAGTAVRYGRAASPAAVLTGFGDYKVDDPDVDSSALGTVRYMLEGNRDMAQRSLKKGAVEAGLDVLSGAAKTADFFLPGTDFAGGLRRAVEGSGVPLVSNGLRPPPEGFTGPPTPTPAAVEARAAAAPSATPPQPPSPVITKTVGPDGRVEFSGAGTGPFVPEENEMQRTMRQLATLRGLRGGSDEGGERAPYRYTPSQDTLETEARNARVTDAQNLEAAITRARQLHPRGLATPRMLGQLMEPGMQARKLATDAAIAAGHDATAADGQRLRHEADLRGLAARSRDVDATNDAAFSREALQQEGALLRERMQQDGGIERSRIAALAQQRVKSMGLGAEQLGKRFEANRNSLQSMIGGRNDKGEVIKDSAEYAEFEERLANALGTKDGSPGVDLHTFLGMADAGTLGYLVDLNRRAQSADEFASGVTGILARVVGGGAPTSRNLSDYAFGPDGKSNFFGERPNATMQWQGPLTSGARTMTGSGDAQRQRYIEQEKKGFRAGQ